MSAGKPVESEVNLNPKKCFFAENSITTSHIKLFSGFFLLKHFFSVCVFN